MLHTQAVKAGTLDLIKKLMADSKFKDFTLVGGTALALKIGHRISLDIDLFSTGSFDAKELGHHLIASYEAVEVRTLTNGVFCFVNDIKIDLIAHQYPLIGEVEVLEGIRFVSSSDIGAMKLNAIFQNGTRLKDFVDMYFLLEENTFEQLLQACQKKYPDINIAIAKNSLIYHKDIDFSDPIELFGQKLKWKAIAERLIYAYHNPNATFRVSELTKKLIEKLNSGEKKKGKNKRL